MAASHKNRIVTLLILIILQTGVLSHHLKAQEQIIDSLENQLPLVDNISRIDYMIELSEHESQWIPIKFKEKYTCRRRSTPSPIACNIPNSMPL